MQASKTDMIPMIFMATFDPGKEKIFLSHRENSDTVANIIKDFWWSVLKKALITTGMLTIKPFSCD